MSSSWKDPISDELIQLAASNYEAQEKLFENLMLAFRVAGLTFDDVAHQLGITVDEASDWLNGEMNLSLNELRQLANTVDAHVSYRVSSIRTRYVRKFEAIQDDWVRTDWATSNHAVSVQS